MARRKYKVRPNGLTRIQLLRWIKSNKTEFVEAPYEGLDGDCWEYTGKRDRAGYGHVRFDGKDQRVHRLSLAEKLKRELEDWEQSRHMCDNPACFNPRHLLVGTNQDNINDKVERGRSNHPVGDDVNAAKGEDHGMAKLTEFEVRRIRQLYKGRGKGPSQAKIGKRFGVTQGAVSRIVNGESWL